MANQSRFGILIEANNRARAAIAEADRQIKELAKTTGATSTPTNTLTQSSNALSRAMGAVSRDVKASAGSLGTFGSAIAAVGGPLGAFTLATAAVGASLLSLANHAGNVQEQMDNLVERTGLSARTLGALRVAAAESGIAFESIQPGLDIFNRRLGEAHANIGDAREGFAALGVSLRDSSGEWKANEVVLQEAAQRLSELEDPTERARLAMEVFGRSGSRFLNVLSADLEENKKRAVELGLVYEGPIAEAARKVDSSFDRIGTAMQGLGNSLAAIAAISLGPLVEQMAKLAEETAKAAKAAADFSEKGKSGILAGLSLGLTGGRSATAFIGGGAATGADTTSSGGPSSSAIGGGVSGPNTAFEEAIANAMFRAIQTIPTSMPSGGGFAGEMAAGPMALNIDLTEFEEFLSRFEDFESLLALAGDDVSSADEALIGFVGTLKKSEQSSLEFGIAMARVFQGTVRAGVENFVNTVISGSQRIDQAFGNMIQSIVQQLIAAAATKLILSLLPIPGFQGGGTIASGTRGMDSSLIRAGRGETVVTHQVTDMLHDFLLSQSNPKNRASAATASGPVTLHMPVTIHALTADRNTIEEATAEHIVPAMERLLRSGAVRIAS